MTSMHGTGDWIKLYPLQIRRESRWSGVHRDASDPRRGSKAREMDPHGDFFPHRALSRVSRRRLIIRLFHAIFPELGLGPLLYGTGC